MVTITKCFGFEACHHLEFYKGKCHNLHGHSYKLEVTVTGALSNYDCSGSPEGLVYPPKGMIMDFSALKDVVKDNIIDVVDHQNLDLVLPVYPTAENIVIWIADVLESKLEKINISLVRIKLWETDSSYAEWSCGDAVS